MSLAQVSSSLAVWPARDALPPPDVPNYCRKFVCQGGRLFVRHDRGGQVCTPFSSKPASAVSAAASLLQMIRAAISRDWRRVQFTGPEQLTAGICCSSWLRGRHPFITAQQFGSTWALRGVLCSVNQSNTLLVHLNLTSPVHFTGSGEGGGPMAGLV